MPIESDGASEARVTGDSEPLSVGAGKQTLVL